MTPLGTPPPPELGDDRPLIAAWYWQEVQAAGDAGSIADLISGAIDAGVVGHRIPVAGFAQPVPLHQLLGPYRRRPGGEAEQNERWLAGLQAAADPVGRRRRQRKWIP